MTRLARCACAAACAPLLCSFTLPSVLQSRLSLMRVTRALHRHWAAHDFSRLPSPPTFRPSLACQTLAAEVPQDVGFFLVPWGDDAANEAQIKEETRATLRCYPFAEQHRVEGKACFFSGKPATHMALFARAY